MTINSGIKKILFDFDGVIVDSNEMKRECFLKVANLYGDRIQEQFHQYCENHPGGTRFEKMRWLNQKLAGTGADISRNELIDQYSHCVKAGLLRAASVEGLRVMKQRYPDATWSIVSAAPAVEIRWYLEQKGWLGLFEDGVFGAPRSKKTVLDEEYNAAEIRQNAVFLGDSKSDFKVANEFGVDFVFVRKWSRDPWLAEYEDVPSVESVSDFFR